MKRLYRVLFRATRLRGIQTHNMGLKIDTQTIGGLKIGNEIVGGIKVGTEIAYKKEAPTPVDRPGTLVLSAIAGGTRNRGAVVSGRLADSDGIRSLTTAVITARDGTTQNEMGDFTRSDTNTFAYRDTFNNARWRSGSMTVSYVDGTDGQTKTLTTAYSI